MEKLQDGIYKVEKTIRGVFEPVTLCKCVEYARVADGCWLIVSDGRKVLNGNHRRMTMGSRPYEWERINGRLCKVEYRFIEAC